MKNNGRQRFYLWDYLWWMGEKLEQARRTGRVDGEMMLWHYKIFCVNRNTGFRKESRIFYFIHLQNEEDYERKESSSA